MKEMRTPIDKTDDEIKRNITFRLKLFVLRPLLVGLFTFSIFFSVILFTKIITYLMQENSAFILNIHDVLFAFIGFLIGYLIEFLLQFRRSFLK